MSDEIAKVPVDPTQFPEAAHKHARRALREHQRAGQNALNAVQHAVKSGQALLKAYDLCEHGQWEAFFEMHFQQDPDKDKRLPLRTARTYMRLARNWSLLSAQHPNGFSSQRQAMKALAAIVQADKSDPSGLIPAARSRNADGSPAARSQARGKRTGPVWKASGPFVREALQVIDSVDAPMMELVAYGAPLTAEAEKVRAAFNRLRAMLESELEAAEAERAASQESDRVAEAAGGTPTLREGRAA